MAENKFEILQGPLDLMDVQTLEVMGTLHRGTGDWQRIFRAIGLLLRLLQK